MVVAIHGFWNSLKLLFLSKITEIRQICSNNGLSGDCFWLLDVFLLLVGLRTNTTSKWSGGRLTRFLINGLYVYQSTVAILHLIYALKNENTELLGIVFHAMKASGLFVAGAKVSLVAYSETSIANVRSLIAGNRIFSGDDTYDTLERKKFNQSTRKMLQILYALLVIDAIFLCIPCAATKKLFTLPPPLAKAGNFISPILYVCSAQFLFIGAVPKFFSNMACIGTLIIGMRSRLKILAHRWDRVLNYPLESPELYFERMDHEVRIVLDQQMDYWRQFQTLKDLVEKSFFIVHYYSLYSIGSCFFIAREIGLNVLTGVIYASAFAYLMKHFLWCHLVDSLQDVADAIGDEIYVHCMQMPYSRKYHTQYVQMKTSLMIVWFNTVNGVSIKCMGMINITTATFGDLINIIYSVVTFLINMA